MNLARRIPKFPKTAAAFLLVVLTAGTALAIDQPPQDSDQQRSWLVGHLVTDMKALGTFSADDFGKVSDIVNAMTDDQVALMSQFYYLTRAKTLQDSSLYAMQQQGCSEEEVNGRKAEIADLLTYQQEQIDQCYAQFQPMGVSIWFAAQVVYSSVPGWCAYSQFCVPEWYYNDGGYVGCTFNRDYCGGYSEPVYNAWYDNASHFNSVYNRSVFIERSITKARRQADWYHNRDWQRNLKHDRLVHSSGSPYHSGKHQGIHVSKQYQNGKLHDGSRTASQSKKVHSAIPGKYQPKLAHKSKPQSHASQGKQKPRSLAWHQGSRPSHVQAKSHVNHAPATQAHASRPAAHAAQNRPAAHKSHPKPAAHATNPKPAVHAQPHAAHPQQQKHR